MGEGAPLQYQFVLPLRQSLKVVEAAETLNIEKTLSQLLDSDLTFKGQNTAYASHSLHAFAAKFPPQIPNLFINNLTRPGELVLDPMLGSGTTLVETVLNNRYGIGVDLDPLASLISRVKSAPPSLLRSVQFGNSVLGKAKKNLADISDDELYRFYSAQAVEFFRYWFEPSIVNELFALIQAIKQVENVSIRALLKVVFSSCIITKSGGLTRARDLAHSRPHRDLNRQVKQSAFEIFRDRLKATVEVLEAVADSQYPAFVIRGDARSLPIASNSVHLIVTSPPYAANAIDYMRAHKFSLIWFGFEPKALSSVRRRYIGSELRPQALEIASETGCRIIENLKREDKKRADVVAHYFSEMKIALKEMLRVLADGRAAVLVVGSSIIRGIDIKAPTVLAELADSVGFRVISVAKREIVRNSRMMPVSHNSSRNGIEARMHEEGVIGLVKPIKGAMDADTRTGNHGVCATTTRPVS